MARPHCSSLQMWPSPPDVAVAIVAAAVDLVLVSLVFAVAPSSVTNSSVPGSPVTGVPPGYGRILLCLCCASSWRESCRPFSGRTSSRNPVTGR